MGEREDPARLVFTSKTGPAIATSLVDLGDRFRLIINDVDCKKVEKPMPKLPVGSAFWTPQPDLATGAEAWILQVEHIILPLLMILQQSRWVTGLQQWELKLYTLTKILQSVTSRMSFAGMKLRFEGKNA